MSRSILAVVAATALAIVSTATIARHYLKADERELSREFSQDKLDVIDEAVLEIARDLERIEGDLRLASRLARSASTRLERQRELGALVAVVPAYRAVDTIDQAGYVAQVVLAPDTEAEFHDRYVDEIRATAVSAIQRGPGSIELSPPLAADESGWYRVIAFSAPRGGKNLDPSLRAVAFLLDTRPFFEKLRLVTAESQTFLLVLGAHGRPVPLTSTPIANALASRESSRGPSAPELAALVARMQAGERGTVVLPERTTRGLGIGAGELVVAYAPVPAAIGESFKVATLSGTSSLHAHRSRLFRQALLAVGLISAFVALLGWYIARSSRKRALLEENLAIAAELSHLHEKADKILDHIPTGVIALAEDGTISGVNRVLRDRLTMDPKGMPLSQLLAESAPALLPRLESLLRAARESGTVQSALAESARLFRVDAQFNLHVIPIATPFRDTAALVVIEDLTQLRSLESQLIRSEKLATVGVLAAGIAHEIGTPLGVVRGRAEFVLGKLDADSPHARSLTVIVEQIDQVSRTIRQLLDFSRQPPTAGGTSSIELVVGAVVELLRLEASTAKVTLTVELPSLPPVAVDTDSLQQVLVNLVVNSIHACVDGGTVHLSARLEQEAALSDQEVVLLEVIDDGCGIPPENRNKVFDPFFTTKKRGIGTGLGLSIVSQLVGSQGGAISLVPNKPRGTRVTVTLPVAKRDGLRSSRTKEERSTGAA